MCTFLYGLVDGVLGLVNVVFDLEDLMIPMPVSMVMVTCFAALVVVASTSCRCHCGGGSRRGRHRMVRLPFVCICHRLFYLCSILFHTMGVLLMCWRSWSSCSALPWIIVFVKILVCCRFMSWSPSSCIIIMM
jgi:hypothetical protein